MFLSFCRIFLQRWVGCYIISKESFYVCMYIYIYTHTYTHRHTHTHRPSSEIPQFLVVLYVPTTKDLVMYTWDTEGRAGCSCDRVTMGYTQEECCNVPLVTGDCKIAGTDVRFPGWYRSDSKVFRRMQQRLWLGRSVTPMTTEEAGPSRSVYTSQWRWHNCSCGKITEKLIWKCTRIRSITTEVLRTSWK